jgi:RND superfamily putative drug exporter
MASLARWCFRHRFLVILGWITVLVVLGGASGALGNNFSNSFSLPGTESTRALDLLRDSFPSQAGDSDTIVWRVDSGAVTDQPVRDRITPMLAQVGRTAHVTAVVSPYDRAGAGQVSKDGRTAYATVVFDGQAQDVPTSSIDGVIDAATAARTSGLRVELGGNAIERTEQQPPSIPTLVGIVAAGVILFIAFGSLLSMLIPLITAVLALGAGISTIGLLSHAFDVSMIAPTLAALVGLGVGVDYALFVVTRYRNGIKAGVDPEEAAVTALNTAGRAVLFAGGTVCVALLGLLVLRVSLLDGLAVPAVFAVLFTMAAATTLLPALLGVIRERALSRRERRQLAAEGPHELRAEGFWARWAETVRRRPVALSVLALVVVAALSAPVLSLRLATSDQGLDPSGWTTRKAYDLLADGFGAGFNGPLQLVARTPSGAADAGTLSRLTEQVAGTGGVASVGPVVNNDDHSVAVVQVVPTTAPQDKATSDLIRHLRNDVLPGVTRGSDVTVQVAGVTAIFDDFASVLNGKLPLFIGVIVALGGLLLLVAFRSLLVPLTAAVMNLLAAAVTFGVITAIFQWGWGANLAGFGKGPVDPSLPVVMLAVLFGLSMDYQVFLVSRMHEEWVHTKDNRRAVSLGQAATGRVITAAAAVMVLVFCSFAIGGARLVAEFGIGLATAVLFDAFVLRTVLVPAVMHLFGASNWYLPRWLDRILPHLSVEPVEEVPSLTSQQPVPEPVR